MRQVRLEVHAYEKALVFKNGQLVRVLESGKYWMSERLEVVKYDVTELFYHEIDIDWLIANRHHRLSVDEILVIPDDDQTPFSDEESRNSIPSTTDKESGDISDGNHIDLMAAADNSKNLRSENVAYERSIFRRIRKFLEISMLDGILRFRTACIGLILWLAKDILGEFGFDMVVGKAKEVIPSDLKEIAYEVMLAFN